MAAGSASAVAGCVDLLRDLTSDCEAVADDREVGGAWPSDARDAANTGYAPDESGPAVDASERWCFDTESAVRSGIVAADDVVVVTSQGRERDGPGRVHVVEAVTGAEGWSVEHGMHSTSSPAVAEDLVLVGSDWPTALIAYDLADGSEQWRYETDGAVHGSVTVAEGVAYVGSDDDRLHAVDLDTGDDLWTAPADDDVHEAPAAADDLVVFVSQDHRVRAVEADDGSEVWRVDTGEMILAAPAVADGTVFVPNRAGQLRALELADGDRRWMVDVNELDVAASIVGAAGATTGTVAGGRTNPTTGPGDDDPDPGNDRPPEPPDGINTSPAVTDDTVVVGSTTEHVYALDVADGSLRWGYGTDRTVGASPVVAGEYVYAGDHDGVVYGLDLADGTLRWRHETGRWISSAPAVAEDLLFVANDGATLSCLEPGSV